MRTILSIFVIAFSIAALGAGYLSGRSSIVPVRGAHNAASSIDVRMPAQVAFARSLHGAHSLFAGEDAQLSPAEDAVVARSTALGRLGEDATIALVLTGAGRSLKLETPFLDLPVPLTIVVNASADEAGGVASAAYDRGKGVYAELATSPDADAKSLRRAIAKLRRAIPSLSGVAMHFDDDAQDAEVALAARVLRSEHLRVLDLSGVQPAAQRVLDAANIGARRRDVTIDNHEEPAYVRFMLKQAVAVARGRGAAVIVAHPHPESLVALQTLVAQGARHGVNFTAL